MITNIKIFNRTFFLVLACLVCIDTRPQLLQIDELIKNELSFISNQSSLQGLRNQQGVELELISLRKCDKQFAYFEKGNIINSELIVDITKSEKAEILKEVRIIFGRYGLTTLPDSVISDITQPITCISDKRKDESMAKVYRSKDKRRLYIVLPWNNDAHDLNVIWVILDKKYHKRFITNRDY